jgi:hypothetical protein
VLETLDLVDTAERPASDCDTDSVGKKWRTSVVFPACRGPAREITG